MDVIPKVTMESDDEPGKKATGKLIANRLVPVRSTYQTPTPEELMNATTGQAIISGRKLGLLDKKILRRINKR